MNKTHRPLLLVLSLLAAVSIVLAAYAAETVSTDTLTVTTQQRTWRIQIFTDYAQPYRVEFLREEVKTLPDASVLARAPLPAVTRAVVAVQADSVTLANGKTITGAELTEALVRFGDTWAAQDATPPPAP